MAETLKTPGVYIVEKNAFPNTVVEVETAVPAFIGYTQRATRRGGSLLNKPFQITSLDEFHEYFGFAPQPMFTMSTENAQDMADKSSGNMGHPLAPALVPIPAKASVTIDQVTHNFQQSSGDYLLYHSMRMFFANGGGKCYIVSVGGYEDKITRDDLSSGIDLLVKEELPTLVVTPDAVGLNEADCISVQQKMLSHCHQMGNRMAILDIWKGWADLVDVVVDNFRSKLGTHGLKNGAAYYPWLETTVVSERSLGLEHIENKADLVKALTKENAVDQKTLNEITAIKYSAIELQEINEGLVQKHQAMQRQLRILNETLRAQSNLYRNIVEAIADKLNLLPPSAAMAGVYTRVDNQHGVWKAPANVSVSMVNKPAVDISHEEQEDLNVTPQGKSINAIRTFVGEGTLVWGARTLDGNSLDWRYVSVRRTMIMLEASIRLAAKAFVFEPNDANTWVTLKSLISNFLTVVWSEGGLQGAAAEDAFSVRVGLGETMTPADIHEGIMRFTILVAVTRPAEFIEITFQQQMAKS
ncbi:MAG: phage tail sheath C-terminal domain-containing protein [Pseudomonadota bacterium]